MPALHHPERHEPLTDTPWDETRVRDAVRRIATQLLEHERSGEHHFRMHPADMEGRNTPRRGLHTLYEGGAGVWWALWTLQRAGAIDADVDFAAAMRHTAATHRAEPDTGTLVPSYFLGTVGVDMVRWRIDPGPEIEQQLHDAVRANIDNPTNEALWAAPGTMLAAWQLWRATQDPLWRDLLLDNVQRVWNTWVHDERAGCHLWTQDLYGTTVQYLGAGHGWAGNVYPLLLCRDLLDDTRARQLVQRTEHALQQLALHDDGRPNDRSDDHDDEPGAGVNWPPGTYIPRPDGPKVLMQWCHGAPGIVVALSPLRPGASSIVDALLLGAGRAIWRAGPLIKGPGLCHGTAGNGYALLKLYSRMGNALWLHRARRFAMHALQQLESTWAREGRARPSLWTGDAGVTMFLHDCLLAHADWPTLDRI